MEAIYFLNKRRTHQATAVKLLPIDPKSTFEVEISFALIEEIQYFFCSLEILLFTPLFSLGHCKKIFLGGQILSSIRTPLKVK